MANKLKLHLGSIATGHARTTERDVRGIFKRAPVGTLHFDFLPEKGVFLGEPGGEFRIGPLTEEFLKQFEQGAVYEVTFNKVAPDIAPVQKS